MNRTLVSGVAIRCMHHSTNRAIRGFNARLLSGLIPRKPRLAPKTGIEPVKDRRTRTSAVSRCVVISNAQSGAGGGSRTPTAEAGGLQPLGLANDLFAPALSERVGLEPTHH